LRCLVNPTPDSGPISSPASGRRAFIQQAAGAAALLCLRGESTAAAAGSTARPTAPPAAGGPDGIYLFFSPDEAGLVESLVEHMCPADELTPGGVDCGLAVFIDRQLAGAFGQGDRLYLRGPFRAGLPEDGYQGPSNPAQYFKAGTRAFDDHCLRHQGAIFARLDTSAKESSLTEAAAGRWDDATGFPLGDWFNALVYPLFEQACFADPAYGGNRDKIFWKMIGYPGLPAVNGLNMVRYRGKPFPGARTPQAMEDFA
jgi:gluconate 2-dehydrogenase gamma chain